MEFVTFEITKKLKEKQFNKLCESFYALEDFTEECVDSCGDYYEVDFEKGKLYLKYPLHYNKHKKKILSAPTISQVLKWLREEKKIICLPHIDSITEKWFFYVVKLPQASDFPEYMSLIIYNTYEEAALAGIEYILDEII